MALQLKMLACRSGVGAVDLVTVSANKAIVVKTTSLVNRDSAPCTVNLYVRRSGTDYAISPKDVILPAGAQALYEDEITLSAGDILKSNTSATALDAVVCGIERDA